ncbi:helix-turn-helix transcriptional regulator [Syntrophus aciditrophicus]|uniref:Transcriptional regulator n=1 Tax=Syntrophus aciditrophicus (strain SB) TaxID=56780 RepID=Q2LRT3_SYNAS|nr:WYL domain-containing transcriptional regulator [Syntrophus aciditrophicus]ABC76790.1 transcriptional regulator [Syntrophus aciditrophicus SB]
MTEKADGKARIVRLGQILRIFMEKEKVSSTWLSRQFQTTPRTIQRDLLLLKKSGFPLHEIRKGIYQLHKDLVRNLEVFDDTELALVVALKNIVGQLGRPFQTAAGNILDHLYDCVKSMPVFVKIDDAVPLDSALLNRILQAILKKRTVSFQYAAPHGSHAVNLEPYRVVYFSGFWYLIGNEPSTGILKRYALDKIENFKSSRQCFTAIPSDLDDVLRQSANIWFTEDANIEITVHIDARVSDYFKRRKMYPTQEIKEERPDGSLVVTFRVGNYEAIRDILKSWIPHFVILEPEDFRVSMLNDIKGWVEKQEQQSCLDNISF